MMPCIQPAGYDTAARSRAQWCRAGFQVVVLAKTSAAAAGLCPASSCQTDVRTSAPWQGFKATAPKGFEPRPVGAEPVSIEDAPSVRSTDARTLGFAFGGAGARESRGACPPVPEAYSVGRAKPGEPPRASPPGFDFLSRSADARTPPDLLNTPKGLSMAKTACVSLQTALKFVPVPELMKPAQISQTVPCRPLNRRFYTLCEVGDGDRQFVPPLEPASSRRQNAPFSGSSADRLFGRSEFGRRILSGFVVIPGLCAMGCTISPTTQTTHPAPALGWHGKTPRKPIELNFGGAK